MHWNNFHAFPQFPSVSLEENKVVVSETIDSIKQGSNLNGVSPIQRNNVSLFEGKIVNDHNILDHSLNFMMFQNSICFNLGLSSDVGIFTFIIVIEIFLFFFFLG